MYDPQDDKGECPHCDYYLDSHTDDQHDACDLKEAIQNMPKKGLRFLVYKGVKDMDINPEYGPWHWIDMDSLSAKDFEFVKMAVKDGEILEDLG